MTQVATTQPTEVSARKVKYTPLGQTEEVELSIGMVQRFIANPTKSGAQPSQADALKFIMLCAAKRLNPWTGDAYLVGYDGKNGPEFSLITAHSALLKRAEACPAFRGMESGVIVRRGKSPKTMDLEGAFIQDGDTLLGGWARVHRNDRDVADVGRVKLATYNTNRSRWRDDPETMIRKVAEASALRRAFPQELDGMYAGEEMDAVRELRSTPAPSAVQGGVAGLKEHLLPASEPQAEPQPTGELTYVPDPVEAGPIVDEAPQPEPEPVATAEPTTEELVASGQLEPKGDQLFDQEAESDAYYSQEA